MFSESTSGTRLHENHNLCSGVPAGGDCNRKEQILSRSLRACSDHGVIRRLILSDQQPKTQMGWTHDHTRWMKSMYSPIWEAWTRGYSWKKHRSCIRKPFKKAWMKWLTSYQSIGSLTDVLPSPLNNSLLYISHLGASVWILSRYLLLRSAEHQEEWLHRPPTKHAGVRFHAGAARPVTSNDERQHVADQLVQQGTLQVPHQQLFPNKTR